MYENEKQTQGKYYTPAVAFDSFQSSNLDKTGVLGRLLADCIAIFSFKKKKQPNNNEEHRSSAKLLYLINAANLLQHVNMLHWVVQTISPKCINIQSREHRVPTPS